MGVDVGTQVLCVLVKAPDETLYTGLFLEHLTVEDLKRKIAERYHLDMNAIVSLCRIGKRGASAGGKAPCNGRAASEADCVGCGT